MMRGAPLLLAAGALSCAAAPAPPARGAELAPVSGTEGWARARTELASLRARLVAHGERGYRVSASFREGHTGRSFAARGAYAIRAPDALRMQLVGPAGALAMDVWVRGDDSRLAIPAMELVERGPATAARPGRPTAFLRWWLLHPLDGALLSAWTDGSGRVARFVLRADDGAVIDATVDRARDHFDLERRAGSDRETISADGPPCGQTSYRSELARLSVSVRCDGEADAPARRAFDDPDASEGP